MSDKCRKCKGSGKFGGGGPCWSCEGSGEVGGITYQTTNASESTNPAMRYEREHPPEAPVIRATREQVEPLVAKCKAMINEVLWAETGGELPKPVKMWECEHTFIEIGSNPCSKCGMFEAQFYTGLTRPRIEYIGH